MPQSRIEHRAHLLTSGKTIDIPPPTVTEPFVRHQESYDPRDPQPPSTYGETTTGPLGWIVHTRSGDKGSDRSPRGRVSLAQRPVRALLLSLAQLAFVS